MSDQPAEKKLSLAERARMSVKDGLKARSDAGKGGSDAAATMAATQTITRWLRRVLAAVVVFVMIYGIVRYEIYRFPASYNSMMPAFAPGQSVVVDRFPATFPSTVPDMKVGDVVVFIVPRGDGTHAERVARIIGRPGDLVTHASTAEGAICFEVNGVRPMGPGPRLDGDGEPASEAPGEVPPDTFFVLEDSRDPTTDSFDSRDFGFLPYENVHGRVALSWRNSGAPKISAPADGN